MSLPTSESVLQTVLSQKVRFKKTPQPEPFSSFFLSPVLEATLPQQGTCMDAMYDHVAVGCKDGSIWINGTLTKQDDTPIIDVTIQPNSGKVFYTVVSNNNLVLKCVGVSEPLFTVENTDAGGGVCFDDENHLYFGIGVNDQDPQDHRTLYGKIVRIFAETPDIPFDNPFAHGPLQKIFRPEIYHSGLRNPKELIWDKSLWVMDSCVDATKGYQNIYCLEDPSNCRYGWYDGFRPLQDVAMVHESTFILPQATPHMSYQDPSIQKSCYLDCLPEIGSNVVGGCLLANHAFLFADQEKGFLAFMPKRELGNVFSQDNDITPVPCKDWQGPVTSIAARGKEVLILSRTNLYRALPREI